MEADRSLLDRFAGRTTSLKFDAKNIEFLDSVLKRLTAPSSCALGAFDSCHRLAASHSLKLLLVSDVAWTGNIQAMAQNIEPILHSICAAIVRK